MYKEKSNTGLLQVSYNSSNPFLSILVYRQVFGLASQTGVPGDCGLPCRELIDLTRSEPVTFTPKFYHVGSIIRSCVCEIYNQKTGRMFRSISSRMVRYPNEGYSWGLKQ